jgi:hypothetical protein
VEVEVGLGVGMGRRLCGRIVCRVSCVLASPRDLRVELGR